MGHPLEAQSWEFPILFHELPPGRQLTVGPAQITAFETRHQIEAKPHGQRVSLGGETLVYSGDTGWFDALPGHVAGASLFICECTFHTRRLEFHLNLEQLLEARPRFDCGRMVLTHLGSEMTDRRGNAGIETADDGMRIKL
jgi:ribonuclease BN (tRNA processing enzyme)